MPGLYLFFLSRGINCLSFWDGRGPVQSAFSQEAGWSPGRLACFGDGPIWSTESQQDLPALRAECSTSVLRHPVMSGHCRVLSSVSGLHPLVASSTPPVMITNSVPRGCQLSCCVGATWSWQPGWGWEDSSSSTAMCMSSAHPQESTLTRGTRVRVW